VVVRVATAKNFSDRRKPGHRQDGLGQTSFLMDAFAHSKPKWIKLRTISRGKEIAECYY
jgi:hypothetical protein